jgi:hypothetical protein
MTWQLGVRQITFPGNEGSRDLTTAITWITVRYSLGICVLGQQTNRHTCIQTDDGEDDDDDDDDMMTYAQGAQLVLLMNFIVTVTHSAHEDL